VKRSSRIVREGEYEPLPEYLAEQCRRTRCQCCTKRYGALVVGKTGVILQVKQCLDHIFPVRFLEHIGLDGQQEINILSLCNVCHGRKLKIETQLFAGDVFSFITGLNRIGYPMPAVMQAARHYGFTSKLLD